VEDNYVIALALTAGLRMCTRIKEIVIAASKDPHNSQIDKASVFNLFYMILKLGTLKETKHWKAYALNLKATAGSAATIL
jgi:hypothetical protein